MPEPVLSPLQYTGSGDLCDPKLREGLQVTITEVQGESPIVVAGKTYLVRGTYVSSDPSVATLCPSGLGRNRGKAAAISLGSGAFEVTAEPVEVVPGKETVLDLLMFDQDGAELGVRLRLQLRSVDL